MAEKAVVTAVGGSLKPDAARCGKEASEIALQKLAGAAPKLAVVFGSSWLDQSALLGGVRSTLGEIPLVGGSTAGELLAEGPVSHSCAVMLIAGREIAASVGLGTSADSTPRQAGQQAAFNAVQKLSGQKRAGFIFIGDGLVRGYADIIRGLQEALGTSFLIAGGMAGDDLRFSKTFQYADDRLASQAVCGALLGGSLHVGVGLEHGFVPISRPRRITRAKANILFELDRRPACAVYEEYFGAEAVSRMRNEQITRQAIAFPLGIQQGDSAQWLLRNVVEFRDDGSLACNAEVLEDAPMQLMMGSRMPAIEAARQAARKAVAGMNHVAGVIIFDAAIRRILLGPQAAAEELAAIRETVGLATPIIGGYSYGEHAALGTATAAERTTIHTGSVLVIAVGT